MNYYEYWDTCHIIKSNDLEHLNTFDRMIFVASMEVWMGLTWWYTQQYWYDFIYLGNYIIRNKLDVQNG